MCRAGQMACVLVRAVVSRSWIWASSAGRPPFSLPPEQERRESVQAVGARAVRVDVMGMTIIGDGTANRQAITKRGHRISVRAILEGLFDGSHSPDRLFEFLFGVLISLDNGLAGLTQIVKLAQLMRHVRQ